MVDFNNDRRTGYFDYALANEFGVEAATVIERFRVWIELNQTHDRNYKDGRYWTFNSCEALVLQFPWLKNKDKAHRLMSKLVDQGVFVKGHHATDRNDRRTWYAFTNEYAKLLNLEISQKCEKASQNCEKDVSNLRNGRIKNAKCNVRNNTETTQNKKRANPQKTVVSESVDEPGNEPSVNPSDLTAEQAEWQAAADAYQDALPPAAEVTIGMLEAMDIIPANISLKPLRMQLLAVAVDGVPAQLWLDWLACRRPVGGEIFQQSAMVNRCAEAYGVTPVAVLLYSLKQYRDSDTPVKRRLPCFPRTPRPIAESQPSQASLRAAKSAPKRGHAGMRELN